MIIPTKKTIYFFLVAFLVSALFIFNDAIRAQAASFIDIGLTVNQGTQASPDIQRAAIEDPAGAITSPLKLAKNGVVYSVALVDPSDPLALKVLIKLPSGVIKALRKFGSDPTIPVFSNQCATAQGYSNGVSTSFYATFTIPNNSPYSVQFSRIAFNPIHLESAPTDFLIGPNNPTYSRGGFGNITFSGDHVVVPSSNYAGEGSATYNIIINGNIVGTATYCWDYPL